jgi:hypothetical protein
VRWADVVEDIEQLAIQNQVTQDEEAVDGATDCSQQSEQEEE